MKGRGAILFCLAALLLAGLLIISQDSNVEAAPTAYFTYLPNDPVVDEPVTFDASISSVKDLQYSWDFGDGHSSSGMVVNHTFRTVGYHTVILIITNSTGWVDTYSEKIYLDNELDPAVGIVFAGFMIGYILLIVIIVLIALSLFATNLILGGVLAYKTNKIATEYNIRSVAQPYLIAHLIAVVVGYVLSNLILFAIIAHIVIYIMFKSKIREMGIDLSKDNKKGASKPPKPKASPPMQPPPKPRTAPPPQT